MDKQEELIKRLTALKEAYDKNPKTPRARQRYVKKKEVVLRQLSNESIERLMAETNNVYLKQYYSTFLHS